MKKASQLRTARAQRRGGSLSSNKQILLHKRWECKCYNIAKEFFLSRKPRIGISACLLGQKVRHDGGHKRDRFVTEILSRFVEWVPVCPEVEAGMGVPRETVRLVGNPSHPRMVAGRSGKDWTNEMEVYSRKRLERLSGMNLSGYILKKNSPSCGMERVKVYGKGSAPKLKGRGLFAQSLMTALPLLPVEEEGRLNDLSLRENFIERVFAYHRWQSWMEGRKSLRSLADFHARHRFLLMAHSEKHLRRLGRLVAAAKKRPLKGLWQKYGRLFMEAMATRATARKRTNVSPPIRRPRH